MPQYTEDQLRQALEDISNGKSQKRASLEYGIPRTTLSPDQESKLAQWVRIQASLGLAPTHQQVKEFAERVLAAAGDTKPLGKAGSMPS
ncbi:transposase [Colletotrichum scovillei]|uniref:transposase n=1 Tax=Colletotrichum scovillei TaxID=1209932 RepID=UPI0015C3D549|nr:transposase [Colletotrichum scovillei]KAF4781425.1 transposase [Colletotrichum scovillei]